MKKTSVFLIASSLVLTAGAVLSYKAQSKTIEPYQIETALENNNDYILGRNLLRSNDARGATNPISQVYYQIRSNSDTNDLRFAAAVKLEKTEEGEYALPGSFGFHVAYSVNSKNFDRYIEVNNFYNSFVAGNVIYTNDETAVGTVEDGKTNASISAFGGDYTHFVFLSILNITSEDTVFTVQSAYKAEGEDDWSDCGEVKFTSFEKKAAIDAKKSFYVVNDNTANLKTYLGSEYSANVGDKISKYINGEFVEKTTEMPKTLEYYYGVWRDQHGNTVTISESGWDNGTQVLPISNFQAGKFFEIPSNLIGNDQVSINEDGTLRHMSNLYAREGSEPVEPDTPDIPDLPYVPGVPEVPDTPETPEEPVKKTISDYYGCYLDEGKNPLIISESGMLMSGKVYTPMLSDSGTSISYKDGWNEKFLILQDDGSLRQISPTASFTKVAEVNEDAILDFSDLYGSYQDAGDNTLSISETCVDGDLGKYPVLYATEGGLVIYDELMSSVSLMPYDANTKTITYFGTDYSKEESSGCAWAAYFGTYKAADGQAFKITETSIVWVDGWQAGTMLPIVSFDGGKIVADGSLGLENYNLQADGSFENYGAIYTKVA